MKIDYGKQGKVQISVLKYIGKILDEAPKDFNGAAVTPSANYLFNVKEKGNKLDYKEREIFHHFVAKVLFLKNHVRRDIQTTIAFLCTRVKSSDQYNWEQ